MFLKSLVLAVLLAANPALAAKAEIYPEIPGQEGWYFEAYHPKGGRRLIAVTNEDPEPKHFVVAVSRDSPKPLYLSRQLYEEVRAGGRDLDEIREHLSRHEKDGHQESGVVFVNIDGAAPSAGPSGGTKTDTNVWNLKGGVRNDGLHGGSASGGVSFSTIIVQPATPAVIDVNAPLLLPTDRPYFRSFRLEAALLKRIRGGLDEKSFGTYLARIKEYGIETLILAYAVGPDGKLLELKLSDGKDFFEVLFRLAKALGFGVYTGVAAPKDEGAARALHARFGKVPAFRGWYLGPRSYCLDRELARWAPRAKELRKLGGEVLLKSSLHASACDGKHEALAAMLKAQEAAFSAVVYEDGLEVGAISAMKEGRLSVDEKYGNLSCGKEICREKALAELPAHIKRVAETHASTRVGWWIEVQALSRSGACKDGGPECPEHGLAQMWYVVLKQLEAAAAKVSQRNHVVLSGAQGVLSFGVAAGELEALDTKAAANRFTLSYRQYLARASASFPEEGTKEEKRKPGLAYCTISGTAHLRNGKTKPLPKEYQEVGGDKEMTGPAKAAGVCAKTAKDIAAVSCVQDDAKKVLMGILIETVLPDGSTQKQDGKYEKDCVP